MPSRPVLIGRGLATQTLNQNLQRAPDETFASTNQKQPNSTHTPTPKHHPGDHVVIRVTAAIATGKHPVPSRTRKLSLPAPMVLQPRGCGRVGRRRTFIRNRATLSGWPCCISGAVSSDRLPSTGAPSTALSTGYGRRWPHLSDAAPRLAGGGDVHASTDRRRQGRQRVRDAVNEVRLVGRISAGARGTGAAQRRRALDVPGGGAAGRRVARDAAPSTRSSARPGAAGRGGRWRRWRHDDVVEVTGAVRRRFFRAGRRRRVAGRGGGGRGPAHPSRSERMSTPRLGLGWKEVAFSGQQPVVARRRGAPGRHSGAGISTATPVRRRRPARAPRRRCGA